MKKHILFIEDDHSTIDVYKTALERKGGFEVEVIELGEEAIERIGEVKKGKARKPDLILLDLILPDMNGIEVLKVIRKEEKTKNIPLYVLTNYGDGKAEKTAPELKKEKRIIKTKYSPIKLVEFLKKELKWS